MHVQRNDVCERALTVSRGSLFQDRLVELGISQKALQPGVLPLQVLQTLRLIHLHPAILFPPPVVGHLGDTKTPDDLADTDTFG